MCDPQKPAKQHDNCDDVTQKDETRIQARYIVVFAAFLLNAVSFMMRINLSVTIVAISLDTETSHNSNDTFGNATQDSLGPQYDWDAGTRSRILSSFFWGFIWTQVPSGYLAQTYGAKKMLLMTVLVTSIMTFLFVPAAALGWEYVCATRVIMGLGQGAMMPSSHTLLSRWAPPNERGRMSVYLYSGHLFGTVVAMSGSGYLCAVIGWPYVYYATGTLGLISAVIWIYLAADTPATCRFASKREVLYIEDSINTAAGTQNQQANKRLATPWGAILTSRPMWALIIVHSAQAWGFWTLITEIPSFMRGVLNFELKKNGLLSSLPFITMWFCSLIYSWASDFMLNKGVWSISISRKLANSIGQYGAATSLIILAYFSSDETLAIFTLTLAFAFNAATMVGYQINHLDLSPNFAGTMMGITNCISNFMSILGPLVVGFTVTENDNPLQWRIVFLIAAGFFIVGNTIFVIFGSGAVQPWNHPDWTKNSGDDEDLSAQKRMLNV